MQKLSKIIKILKKIYNEGDSINAESELIENSYIQKYILKAFISFFRYNHKDGIEMVMIDLPKAYGKKNI